MSAKKSLRGRSESVGRKSPLKEKRKKAAQFVMWSCIVLSTIALGLLLYGLWQPTVRIQHIETPDISGNDELELLARHHIQGTYFFILPKDSFFFFPEMSIQKGLLELRPDIASASVRRSGFDSLAIDVVPRVPAYLWCGETRTDGNEINCFNVDWSGFIFQPAEQGTSTPTLLTRVYSRVNNSGGNNYPITSTINAGTSLHEVFAFIKEIKNLGSAITGIYFHNDEISLYAASGTYLTYVAHREKEALPLLTAALPSASLTDGLVEYLDLRFDGKIYIKRKGEIAKP